MTVITAVVTELQGELADLFPFYTRGTEWKLLNPMRLNGRMLELGNKRNGPLIYKDFFEALGVEHVSIDLNGCNGALAYDLNEPLPAEHWEMPDGIEDDRYAFDLRNFDMVTNYGTTEHVENQPQVWRTICECLALNGVLVSVTPQPHNCEHHGRYYPTKEFYESLADLNGLDLERIQPFGPEGQLYWGARLIRRFDKHFAMPDESLIWVNETGQKVGQYTTIEVMDEPRRD